MAVIYTFSANFPIIILRKYYDELEGEWWQSLIRKRYAKTLNSTNCLKAH